MNKKITEKESPFLVVSVKKGPRVPSYERFLPDGCGPDGGLVYGRGPIESYTTDGLRVEVTTIPRYECAYCGLVALLPEVAKELNETIGKARKRLTATI